MKWRMKVAEVGTWVIMYVSMAIPHAKYRIIINDMITMGVIQVPGE